MRAGGAFMHLAVGAKSCTLHGLAGLICLLVPDSRTELLLNKRSRLNANLY